MISDILKSTNLEVHLQAMLRCKVQNFKRPKRR